MKEQKLNYRFHNLNTVEATADILLRVFIEANQQKVETVIRQAAEQADKAEVSDT